MICKIKDRGEAWECLRKNIDCDEALVFDLSEYLNCGEIPVSLYRCHSCGCDTFDTLEEVILRGFKRTCPLCDADIISLITVEFVVQRMEILFRRDWRE